LGGKMSNYGMKYDSPYFVIFVFCEVVDTASVMEDGQKIFFDMEMQTY
jgi:hypothetical protein